ncbi:hypothetical protein AYO40_02225 [Planctomycetaceae bacterium SCGC AG-212-D15]|nr:hypothetical protein AYO40_02225 [Planctomycetaceae bacterium SCGC AG-212-D15]
MTAFDQLREEGELLIEEDKFAEALEKFQGAWKELAEPNREEDAAIEILAAIADCHFFLKNWDACHDAMQQALRCGADIANPFIRLRLGQSLYELGDEQEAANWLVPVYLTEGREPFSEDPKYLEFFRSKLKPPEGGWPEG